MNRPCMVLLVVALTCLPGIIRAQAPPPAPAPTPAPAPGPTPATPQVAPQPLSKPDAEAVGRAVIAELAARNFDKVFARLREHVAQTLNVDKLTTSWDKLLLQVGAFRSVTAVEKEERQGLQVAYLTCAFERASLELVLAVDADSRVAALNFIPLGMRAGWKPAAYVKADSFQERKITVGGAPWQLPGTLTLPSGAGPFPAVVLVHGSGPGDQDESVGPNKPFKDLAWGLATRGIAVLRYSKRTRVHGRQMAELPDGFTVNEEAVEDARAAVDLLANTKEIDPRRIFVVGHSLGGMLAPRIAAVNKEVAGVILLAGNTRPIEELVLEQIRYAASLNGKVTPEGEKAIQAAEQARREIRSPDLKPGMTVKFLGVSTSAVYFLDLRDYHPAEAAAALGLPIFVLQGERDYQVRLADFDGWRKALAKQPTASFKLYPGLNHLFMSGAGPSSDADYLNPGHVEEDVIRDIAGWIAAHGPPPSAPPAKAAP